MIVAGQVALRALTKGFGGRNVVDGIDLDVAAGEFFSLLGPSGCGKTTTLRMIAGFETPDSGRIEIDGEDVAGRPPEKRPVNTVFQNYALFPHLDVESNVAFGLRLRNESSDDRRAVGEALDLVRLGGFGKRRVHKLSGGEQQRVALARALVLRPRVLLLDEPLGALDAQLRKELQAELSRLQREVGITFVYVTHDQEEALSMSDRLGIVLDGRLVGIGSPRDLYDSPGTVEAARFLGTANVFSGANDRGGLDLDGWVVPLPSDAPSGSLTVMIRPERVVVDFGGSNALVERTVFAGATEQIHLLVGSHRLVAVTAGVGRGVAPGSRVGVSVAVGDVRLLAAQSSI